MNACGSKAPDSLTGTSQLIIHTGADNDKSNAGSVVLADISKSASLLAASEAMTRILFFGYNAARLRGGRNIHYIACNDRHERHSSGCRISLYTQV